jgi:hypothetical protein
MKPLPARAMLAKPGLRRKAAVWAVGILVGGTGLAWAGRTAWVAYETWGTPTCSWPVQVRGASLAQAGLIRCYLRALAHRDTAGLMAVAADIPPVRITEADFRYSADARAGLATATSDGCPVDLTFCGVTITYADGVTENTDMMDMVAMGGPSGWRMTIGTVVNPGPAIPSAAAGPSSRLPAPTAAHRGGQEPGMAGRAPGSGGVADQRNGTARWATDLAETVRASMRQGKD